MLVSDIHEEGVLDETEQDLICPKAPRSPYVPAFPASFSWVLQPLRRAWFWKRVGRYSWSPAAPQAYFRSQNACAGNARIVCLHHGVSAGLVYLSVFTAQFVVRRVEKTGVFNFRLYDGRNRRSQLTAQKVNKNHGGNGCRRDVDDIISEN